MRKWTQSAALLFLAASSVYFGQATVAGEETPAKPADNSTDTRLIAADTGSPSAPSATITSIPADPKAAAPSTPPKVTMNDSGTFSIQIGNDSNIVELLRQLGNQAQLSIIPSKEVRGTVPAMDLYNVTIREALDAILHSCGMGWRQKGNFVYVYSQRELAEIDKASRVTHTQVFHLYYTTAANMQAMIHPAMSADGIVAATTAAAVGIDSSSTDAGGNAHAGDDMLVVTDYPENLEKIAKIIKDIDHRPQQVLIEATILQATLTDNNAMGIDFSFMGGINFDSLLANDTSVSGALSGNILNSSTSSTGTTGGTTSTNTAQNVVHTGYAGVTTGNFDTQVPPGGLQIGIVHRNIGVFLQALESITDTVVLANPKILALDKQRGEVIVGRQDGYLTTTTTATSSTQTVEFLETGTRLLFRPYVGEDGYVRMEIHPEDSNGGLTSTNLPFKVTTEVTSNVMVKDGNTIVIGGLFRENNQTSRSQVPWLGNLPLAGPLFRNQADQIQRSEIIILLTPHVVKDDAAYAKLSDEEMKNAERLRVGVRKGMMPFGRERLAESHYENAVGEMHKPHPNPRKAIWELHCATNLNPQFIEAINMEEKLTGRTLCDADNSSIRSFVRRAVEAENAAHAATQPSAAMLPAAVLQQLAKDKAADSKPAAKVAAAPTTKPATQSSVAKRSATPPSVANKSQYGPFKQSTGDVPLEIRVIDSSNAKSPSTRPTDATAAVPWDSGK